MRFESHNVRKRNGRVKILIIQATMVSTNQKRLPISNSPPRDEKSAGVNWSQKISTKYREQISITMTDKRGKRHKRIKKAIMTLICAKKYYIKL
jgi:hypothetical protein